MDFYVREMDDRLAEARHRLGRFVGCDGDDLAFVDNATVGMNIVAHSVRLSPGDEVLATDHEYGAVLRLWEQVCQRQGAKLVVAALPEVLDDAEQVTEALFSRATARTKLVVFSHITSPTAVILPVERLCARAHALGISICIDGPHAPAMVDVNLARLNCDYYVASCHKWLSAPLGSGFIHVHRRAQASIRSIITSWGRTPPGHTPSWRDELVWLGTRDLSAWLAVPTAIQFLEDVGWDAFRARTHALARHARASITDWTGLGALVPDTAEWYGSMISLPLPAGDGPSLQAALWEQDRIEVPIVEWNGKRLVRPSCHLYTQRWELDQLRDSLARLVG